MGVSIWGTPWGWSYGTWADFVDTLAAHQRPYVVPTQRAHEWPPQLDRGFDGIDDDAELAEEIRALVQMEPLALLTDPLISDGDRRYIPAEFAAVLQRRLAELPLPPDARVIAAAIGDALLAALSRDDTLVIG